jgi:hypothetical protein
MKKFLLLIPVALLIVAATYTPISSFPNNPSPTNGIYILLTVPGRTNQYITVGQLKSLMSTDAVVLVNIAGNSNLQSTLARSVWFADNLKSNVEFNLVVPTNVDFNTGLQTYRGLHGTPIVTQVWSNSVYTLQNCYHYIVAPSNCTVTTIAALQTDTNVLNANVFQDTFVITNSSGTNITFTFAAAGNKMTLETTNSLDIPSNKVAELVIEFYYKAWTNYITRLQNN